jgi:hypothetical protein
LCACQALGHLRLPDARARAPSRSRPKYAVSHVGKRLGWTRCRRPPAIASHFPGFASSQAMLFSRSLVRHWSTITIWNTTCPTFFDAVWPRWPRWLPCSSQHTHTPTRLGGCRSRRPARHRMRPRRRSLCSTRRWPSREPWPWDRSRSTSSSAPNPSTRSSSRAERIPCRRTPSSR